MGAADYNQWSSVKPLIGSNITSPAWVPREEQDRVNSYEKYDQMYWNDPRQFALRVLDGEEPLYIPNAREVVDTTAHYLLKGLELTCKNNETKEVLDAFLKREEFFSRFNSAKISGVTRGDFVFHLTADPKKSEGTRLSLTAVHPGNVFPIYDPHIPNRMIRCHIAEQYFDDKQPEKTFFHRLTYELDGEGEVRRVSREEAIYEIEGGSFGGLKAKVVRQILPKGLLDSRITAIPVYWFRNRDWQGEEFGSSELRGIEVILQTISQGSTDVSASLALEGLGVYATDGGRPINEQGVETDWEVAPGKVMEVPQGSYFRRVEGVTSITPAVDQIKYLEEKMHGAVGISDVARGQVDAQVAQSGIALAIKFIPTLAKIETRDQAGIDKLTQLFYDWKTWYAVFERKQLEGDIVPVIGDKLPTDRTARVNELNNMFDRKIISKQYYRDEMAKLGFEFPPDIEDQVEKDAEKAMLQARATMLATKDTEGGAMNGKSGDTRGDSLPSAGNRSNNRNRPNESAGTEATNKTRDA